MPPLAEGLLVALGIGLLIGLMRERRRDEPDSGPSAAGLRTHALASLAAAVAWSLDPRAFLALFVCAGVLVVVSYRRTAEQDIGLTGEFALLLTALLGALAMENAVIAGAGAVVTAGLLHLRSELHHLGRKLISERELHDGLVLAASALVVLPLLPTTPVDPWNVIVPASLWRLVVLVMAAGVLGEIALRVVGARFGLPVAGFFAGFASSTAATVGFGQRVRAAPHLLPYAVSATLFANFGSLLLLVAVLATGNGTLLVASTWTLTAAALALVAVAAFGLINGAATEENATVTDSARAFKLSHALGLAAFVGVLLLASALFAELFGERGALAAAVIGGMIELQGAALVVGQLAESGRVPVSDARWGLVLLLGSSAVVKSVLAFGSGGRAYGARVSVGLAAMVAGAAVAAYALDG